ncbi:hypothetical protein JCM6882_008775 [Rhodosporidiobolus microsporus]
MARLRHPDPLENTRPRPYKLSALLQGHENDVRSLAAPTSTTSSESPLQLLSGSRDCTSKLWERSGGGWEERRSWRDEDGWVNCVAFLPARKEEEDQSGYLVSAGADSQIHLFPLSPPTDGSPFPSPKPAHTLLGHAHNVCAIKCARDGKRLVSASWDLTARVWRWRAAAAAGEGAEGEWECENVLVGHGAAVWDVLLLEKEENLVLTACADSRIRLFDGAEETRNFRGHEGPVRALAKLLPEDADCALFASASNDGTIRIWNYQTGDQVTVLGAHDSFIYSLASLPSTCGGGLASSGEDGIIKVWNEEDGEEDQQILVPALSVWSLAALPNGDLACGCSDNLVWIFTRDDARAASEEVTKDYEGRLAEFRGPKAATPVVADRAALEQAGSKDGEVKLVRDGEATKAYQWDGSNWNEVGEVVNGPDASSSASAPPAPPRLVHDGVEYDYVFSIDVKDDEPPLQLPFNLDDDPHEVSEAFVKQHGLPQSYLEQIVQFIRNSTA